MFRHFSNEIYYFKIYLLVLVYFAVYGINLSRSAVEVWYVVWGLPAFDDTRRGVRLYSFLLLVIQRDPKVGMNFKKKLISLHLKNE